jgi:ATP-binding cassette subfamily B multidrug efflux pump
MSKIQTIWPTLKRLLAYGSPYRKPLGLAVLIWVSGKP